MAPSACPVAELVAGLVAELVAGLPDGRAAADPLPAPLPSPPGAALRSSLPERPAGRLTKEIEIRSPTREDQILAHPAPHALL
ncbi:hypothetical protein ADK38_19380 [Streptomyces varsoviensis]|uniref:Uncharacterized protein n=1 Tax=Streptomyces varsoviensis TaxID=67373 RepID=A0ABR5J5U9_9ACTN|nr:hypothetical protein ADK38_19380 [Streptomyces varsoviensis]